MQTACESSNPLVRKMMAFAKLQNEDCRVLENICERSRIVAPKVDLISEGEKPDDVHLILQGFACRYKILPDGTRHIMAYLLPGDFCDLHVFILREMDHSLGSLSECLVVDIPREAILSLLERPAIAQAFWIAAMVDEATLREWLVNLGGRPATQRVAHLLCELLFRLREVGLASGSSYRLPLTQAELADTVGLSSVHVNRVLQKLRSDGLITLGGDELVIPDIDALIDFCSFNPNYLHLRKFQRSAEASEF